MTDLARWQALAKQPTSPWEGRLRLMAARIPEGSTVIDVGAGGMALRGMLPAGCLYLPVDCVPGSAIEWELDNDNFYAPGLHGDAAVMSGVLEYLRWPESGLIAVSDWAPRILLSYDHDAPPEARVASGWRNHLKRSELYSLMVDVLGWAAVESFATWEGQTLYDLRRA